MPDHSLQLVDGHLFVEIAGALWFLDTGAPSSFGELPELVVAGESFEMSTGFLGIDVAKLRELTGVECAGMLAADVMNRLDFVFDVPGRSVEISAGELRFDGGSIDLGDFLGIPVIGARISGSERLMYFDTGAQISYFQDDGIAEFPPAGAMRDFFPGMGEFETETFDVVMEIGGEELTVRCGRLPGLLGATVTMAGCVGVVGNQIMRDRKVGYFPRRRTLVLGTRRRI